MALADVGRRTAYGGRRLTKLLDLWSIALSALVCHRLLLGAGYGLGRDMVFTPVGPLNAQSLGFGSASPRAVPVDALLGLATRAVGGEWVGRAAVLAALVLAGCGAHRLVHQLSYGARLVASGLAVWNPYVIERLAIGQWALLLGYAALPWLVAACRRLEQNRQWTSWCPIVGWLALASITPTGGVIAVAAVVVLVSGRCLRRNFVLVGVVVVVQLPWVLASVVSTASPHSDSAAIAAFAVRSERFGGSVPTLLGLGGIWDAGSVPGSRSGVFGFTTTVVLAVCLAIGLGPGRRLLVQPRLRLAGLAAAGFLLAALPALPGGRSLLRWAVSDVPGAGLLRDSQKWLAPFVLLVVICVAASVELIHRALRPVTAAAGILLATLGAALPLLLLPDALKAVGPTLSPVKYPADFTQVAERVNGNGPLVTLPFDSYRRFSWGNDVSVADPAPQWFDTTVIVSDRLTVGSTTLAGEDPRAAQIADSLRAGVAPQQVLSTAGVRWALVYLDAPGADSLDLSGLCLVWRGASLALYQVVDPKQGQQGRIDWRAEVIVAAADAAVLAFVLVAAAAATATLGARRRYDCYPH